MVKQESGSIGAIVVKLVSPLTLLVVDDTKELVHSLILFDEDEIACYHPSLHGSRLRTDAKSSHPQKH